MADCGATQWRAARAVLRLEGDEPALHVWNADRDERAIRAEELGGAVEVELRRREPAFVELPRLGLLDQMLGSVGPEAHAGVVGEPQPPAPSFRLKDLNALVYQMPRDVGIRRRALRASGDERLPLPADIAVLPEIPVGAPAPPWSRL